MDECTIHRDIESRGQFRAISACLSLLRGDSLQKVSSDLELGLEDLVAARHRLSSLGTVSLFRHLILRCDLKFASGLLLPNRSGLVDHSTDELLALQQAILDELQHNAGESTDRYVEKSKSCYDNLHGIKNIFNPLLTFLVHAKLRLGSLIMLKAIESESNDEISLWRCAFNTLSGAIEINKVISERSIALEIELNLKCSHCLMSLFTRHQAVPLIECIEAYSQTMTLAYGSTHDLAVMRTCYQEIAVVFMTAMSVSESMSTNPGANKGKKINTQLVKATEAVICALGMAQKVSNAMRNRMLLPGHRAIKNAQQSMARQFPAFVQSDLLAYWVSLNFCFFKNSILNLNFIQFNSKVLSDRKRVFRDEIEEEILSLAPEFEVKIPFR